MAPRDLDGYLRQRAAGTLSRRSFMAAAGLTGTAAWLAACGGGATQAPSAAATSGPTAAPTGTALAGGETEFYMYNWSGYIAETNIEEFKKRFSLANFVYDTYANNEELIAKLQGGASGYDIAAPTAEYVPGMVEEGFLQKLDLSRIPNVKYINDTYKNLWWDPTNEYQVPKDYGTTGILYRGKLVSTPPTSWAQFYEMAKGEASGKTVMVDSMGDVFVFPLKLLGYSLNSVDDNELNEARDILLDVAPHLLALDSDTYQDKMASEEASLVLGWTGPLLDLRANPDTADSAYSVPSEGTLFWMDTWVMMAEAPHPNLSYEWLNFIHEPEIQGAETNYNGYATCSDEAKKYVDQALLDDPSIFPPADVLPSLEGAQDTSGNQHRIDIWEEFKSKIGG
ncbi:MAG: hypothetical protein HW391_190 [Chloroflexi bacterium]|nr:hypothetical protein [Chloroflexota bacterium]